MALSAYMSDLITNNVAENILALSEGKREKTAQRGRRTVIEDGRLWGTRDGLLHFLETTWADVGDKLPRIKKPNDVYDALRVWEKDSRCNLLYVARALLHRSECVVSIKSLNEKRRRAGVLNVSARNSYDALESCCRSFEVAMRAYASASSEIEHATIDEKLRVRARALAHAGSQYLAITEQQREMEQHIKDCEACFARAELVRFCRSRRYRLTPLNVANALAGVPEIGWRQSAKRCKGQPSPALNGGAIQIFNTIRKIVQSCPRKSELAKYAESWLRARKTKSYGISELQASWYYLHLAIDSALQLGTRSRDLPFVIARHYWSRKFHPSNPDVLFAEEERIVV
jgi:hypothetical protein